MEAVVRKGGVHAEGVVFGADTAHKPADQTTARDHVDHRVLFGDGKRMFPKRQRAAQNCDLGPRRASRKRAGGNNGRGHDAVGGLMMLVDGHAILLADETVAASVAEERLASLAAALAMPVCVIRRPVAA